MRCGTGSLAPRGARGIFIPLDTLDGKHCERAGRRRKEESASVENGHSCSGGDSPAGGIRLCSKPMSLLRGYDPCPEIEPGRVWGPRGLLPLLFPPAASTTTAAPRRPSPPASSRNRRNARRPLKSICVVFGVGGFDPDGHGRSQRLQKPMLLSVGRPVRCRAGNRDGHFVNQ